MSFIRYIKSLHVTYYGWHDLPQGLWIINEYFKGITRAPVVEYDVSYRCPCDESQVWSQEVIILYLIILYLISYSSLIWDVLTSDFL
jgi:hypothetical protein